MARQLTPEALRFIQLHHATLPDGEDYEEAETIIEGRPLYDSAHTLVEPRRVLYIVPELPLEPEVDIYEAWLQRETSALVELEQPGLWVRMISAVKRWLVGE
ncbi:MAG: hypothetical protein ACI8RZ_001208 [Myxococcota bacterium]|jgi:hypothetical protein